MGISQSEADDIVKYFLSTPEGKLATAEFNKQILTIEYVKKVANELRSAIKVAIKSIKSTYPRAHKYAFQNFDFEGVTIGDIDRDKDGKCTTYINFSDASLYRYSLFAKGDDDDYYDDDDGGGGHYTGEGIDDIIGLFSKGYNASRAVKGYWEGHKRLGVITSRVHRKANPFIHYAITAFNSKYSKDGIKARYTKDWGGTL